MSADGTVLAVEGLRVEYPSGDGSLVAVDGIDFEVAAGERVGIVGESGSGKSSAAFAIAGLLSPPGRISAGHIRFEDVDLVTLDEAERERMRGVRLSMVYQDPFTFLNPVLRVGDQVAEVLTAHGRASAREARARTEELFEQLGLTPGRQFARKYPHQLSGGQRQRVVIAMAVIARPGLLIADEPTTALDVTVQAQILTLLSRTVRRLGSSLLLISHDLSVIRLMCERVYVMYAGLFVESGRTERIFRAPRHPYTQALLRASSRVLDEQRRFPTIPGVPPDRRYPPTGCRFAERCAYRFERCAEAPPLLSVAEGGRAACWLEAPR
ncbi:MAG TPA: ABC transporter ATP-binding protein [Candidatus Limnocylindria bacterium]|nr:ABC transporter ATP-binding protein [Candidatus Limnocylindria bacterium]